MFNRKKECIMKSKNLLRLLVTTYEVANGAGVYTTSDERKDVWKDCKEYFRSERFMGELKPSTDYLYFFEDDGWGLKHVHPNAVLINEDCKIFLYEM